MNDLDHVARGDGALLVLRAGDDGAVHLYRDGALVEPEMLDQATDTQGIRHIVEGAVHLDLHRAPS